MCVQVGSVSLAVACSPQNGMTRADAVTPLMAKHLAGTYTPSPQMNQEILDLRGKVRNLQDQL